MKYIIFTIIMTLSSIGVASDGKQIRDWRYYDGFAITDTTNDSRGIFDRIFGNHAPSLFYSCNTLGTDKYARFQVSTYASRKDFGSDKQIYRAMITVDDKKPFTVQMPDGKYS